MEGTERVRGRGAKGGVEGDWGGCGGREEGGGGGG